MTTPQFTIFDKRGIARRLVLDREEARYMELRLNLVQPRVDPYSAIADALYEFHTSLKGASFRTGIAELLYLQKLAKIPYETVKQDPDKYRVL